MCAQWITAGKKSQEIFHKSCLIKKTFNILRGEKKHSEPWHEIDNESVQNQRQRKTKRWSDYEKEEEEEVKKL